MSGDSKEKPTLNDLDGVGPTLQTRLSESGYSSLKKLVGAEPEKLAEVKGISKAKAKDLIAQAKKLVPKPKKKKKKKKAEDEEPSLSDISGIGPTLQERLIGAGYKTLNDLVEAEAESIATEVDGISESRAGEMIAEAKKLVPKPVKKKAKKEEPSLSDISGVGPTLRKRLESAGYKTLRDLAKAKAENIAAEVDGISESRAGEMIAQAQDMVPAKAKKPPAAKKAEISEKAVPEIDTEPEIDERVWRIAKKKKQRKPKFRHNQAHRWKRVKDSWRRVRGIDSDIREKKKGHIKMPSAGFRTPKEVRGLHPSGYEEVLVHRPADLEGLDPTKQAVRIGGTVGDRKRQNIIQKADAMMLRVLNPGVEEAIIEEELFEELEGLEDIEVE